MSNVSCLGMDESEAFWDVDWQNPVLTQLGIEISNNPSSAWRYDQNYHALRHELKGRLNGYKNVFTHNPWGEYGHPEHIQIYRAVKDLQNELKFSLWFSNYCSNKSFALMMDYISGFDTEYFTFRTDTILAKTIKNLYKKNGGWTWYDDWEWFTEESFMKDKYQQYPLKNNISKNYGHIFPVNIIKIGTPNEQERQSRTRPTSFMRRLVGRSLYIRPK